MKIYCQFITIYYANFICISNLLSFVDITILSPIKLPLYLCQKSKILSKIDYIYIDLLGGSFFSLRATHSNILA